MALPAVNADGHLASVAKRGTEGEQCNHIGCMPKPSKANTVSIDAPHGDCNHIGCPGYNAADAGGDCVGTTCPGKGR